MKKVLLVTWYANYNYGTALQAYALKTIVENPSITGLIKTPESWEYTCYFLPHTPERRKRKNRLIRFFMPRSYMIKINYAIDRKIYTKKRGLFEIRENAFDKFISDNFHFAAEHNLQNKDELSQISNAFDYVMSGSDQIWNPEALDPVYFLQWVSSAEKISYGSSLSIQVIPQNDVSLFHIALNDFKSISIRDSACREQLSAIVGKPVTTVVDPVLLIGQEGLTRNCKQLNLPSYLFCYFLGNNKKHRTLSLTESKKKELEIHSIINVGSNFPADKQLEEYADWDVDPWKFVSYINEATFVITDSFHATVISVLCHTSFVVLEKDSNRPEQNNRILEFLKSVGLSGRWGTGSIDSDITQDEWSQADIALNNMRLESLKYLMEALR
mgnify:FL=1